MEVLWDGDGGYLLGVDRHTDTCQNITFARTSYARGKNSGPFIMEHFHHASYIACLSLMKVQSLQRCNDNTVLVMCWVGIPLQIFKICSFWDVTA